MIELEKTYLVKELPKDLLKSKSKEIIDIYVPATVEHPILRIRKNGDKFEITKKSPIEGKDNSQHTEETIHLTATEFEALAQVKGKRIRKIRYYYDWEGWIGEIDVFQDGLFGLVLADFEFNSEEELSAFKMPPFCLTEVTQEESLAGGMLCGKSYSDIEDKLAKFGYRRII